MHLESNLRKPHVLIVDDEEEIRSVISTILMDDFVTIEAENGLQAIQLLKSRHVDVVMTDYNMPVLNGLELLKSLHECAMGLPIIVLTGRGSQELHRKTVGLNVAEYMEKPFHPEELIRAVRTAMALKVEHRKEPETLIATVLFGDLQVRLPKALLQNFEKACVSNGTSMSTQIQAMIEKYLAGDKL